MPPAITGSRPRPVMPAMASRARRANSPAVNSCVRIDDIDQVVWNPAAFFRRQLGGADIEVAEDLQGIAVDDFTVEFFSDCEGQIAFSGAGGTDNRNQRVLCRVSV